MGLGAVTNILGWRIVFYYKRQKEKTPDCCQLVGILRKKNFMNCFLYV